MKTTMNRTIAVLLVAAILMGSLVMGAAAKTRFTDVKESDWFYDDVVFMEENGLMEGISPNRFAPNEAATRAMMATIFWRFENMPEPEEMSGYKDVPNGQWYSKAIAWMKETELTNGAGNNKYGTNDPVTREELATFFYRYAIFKGYNVEEKNSLSNYSDCGKIHNWAVEGLSWANANGIVSGRTPTMMAPQGTATRAEIAAMIHRFIANVVEAQTPPTEETELTEPTAVPTEPTEPTDVTDPSEPSDNPTEPTELTEPTEPSEEPTEPTEPEPKTATVILMVDDIYGEAGQYPNYRFALRLDPNANLYGEYFDENGLMEGHDPYDLDTVCWNFEQNAYEDRLPGESDEVSFEIPVGTYDVLVGCHATPGQFMPDGIFVPDNSTYDDFEIEEGKVYVFYVSAKGYSEDPTYNKVASLQAAVILYDYPGNCTGTAVTLFVGNGEKPEIDTAQLPHCHNWERVEHEQVRFGVYKIRCSCGEWTSCYFTSQNEGDVLKDWDDHLSQFSPEEQFQNHGSYADATYFVTVSPAYSSWVCSDCGEERWVSPGAMPECACHTWERVRFREQMGFYRTERCACGWESTWAGDVMDGVEQLRAHVEECAGDGNEHRFILSPYHADVYTPSYDVWICTHCGKISHEQPEADDHNHVDTDKVWLYSDRASCCECGMSVTVETSNYYGDFHMEFLEHYQEQHPEQADYSYYTCRRSMLWDECWTLIESQEEGNP